MLIGILVTLCASILILGYVADRKQKKKKYLNEFDHASSQNANRTAEHEAASRTYMDPP